MSDESKQIEMFLEGSAFAVVGASANRSKYGNKILRCYLQHGRQAVPVNPVHAEIEGEPCFEMLLNDCESAKGPPLMDLGNLTSVAFWE